jgi:hypothetical protein
LRDVPAPYAARWEVEWAVAVDPHGGRFRYEDVRVIALSTRGALAGTVAKARLDAYARSGGEVEGPTPTSVGGLPAFEGWVIGYARYGRDLARRVVVVVDGTTAYEISCQYEPDSAEVIAGCHRVVDSFELSV